MNNIYVSIYSSIYTPSRGLTYPTLEKDAKGTSSSKVPLDGIC